MRRFLVAGVLVLALAAGLAAWARTRTPQEEATAPDVALATFQGEFRLSQHRGEVIVLYFSFPG